MNSIEILPCPRCGRLPKQKFKHDISDDISAGYTCIYYCKPIFEARHFVVSGFHKSWKQEAEEAAVQLWNKKVISYQKDVSEGKTE